MRNGQIARVLIAIAGTVATAMLYGCAAGSAYSVKAGKADDLTTDARMRIIEEAFQRSKEYTDTQLRLHIAASEQKK